MEYLFLIAEKISITLKKKLSVAREQIGIVNFDKAIINNSSFEIFFSSSSMLLEISLNINHLEIPWSVKVNFYMDENKISLNDFIKKNKNNEIVYEVYPNLLKDPNNLGLNLAEEIGVDIVKYLTNQNV
jgi:hypothetical protein